MADTKISALTGATTPLAGTEVLPIVQSSTTKQVSVANLTAGRSVTATNFIPSGSSVPTNGVYLPAANAVGIATNTTNAIYINSSQNVGIGNPTTIEAKLKVATTNGASDFSSSGINVCGAAEITSGQVLPISFTPIGNDSTRARAAIGCLVGTNWGFGNLGFYTRGVADGSVLTTADQKMLIDSSGVVTMNAYGAGAATFSSAGVISSVSDENWKRKDGVPSNPIEMLNKLEPGYWYYNDKYKDTYGVDRQLGFYAQNVNAAIGPEAAPEPESYMAPNDLGVETLQQKPWGYYDRSVLAVVVMALKDALKSIETLEARISSLEQKIQA
jgi:Chaperone of endosialidase